MKINFIHFVFLAFLIFQCFSAQATEPIRLSFDAKNSGALDFYFNYDIQDDSMKFGDIVLNSSNFALKEQVKNNLNKLVFTFPLEVFEEMSAVDLVLSDGSILYHELISYNDLKFNEWVNLNSQNETKYSKINLYPNAEYSVKISDEDVAKIKKLFGVRVCLTHQSMINKLKRRDFCSVTYQIKKNQIVLKKTNLPKKVILNNIQTESESSGEIKLNAKDHSKIDFFAQNESGMIVQFKDTIPNWSQFEVISLDANHYKISGVGPRPFKFFMDHFTYKNKSFFYEFKFAPFLSEEINFWSFETQNKEETLNLSFLNFDGGLFVAKVILKVSPEINNIPGVKDIANPQLTYSSSKILPIHLSPKQIPKDQSLIKSQSTPNTYYWALSDLRRFSTTKRKLQITSQEDSDKSIAQPYFLEVHRGAPFDFNLQYTLSRFGSHSIYGKNFNFHYWIEDFWGLADSSFLRLRLGIYGKYFQAQKSESWNELNLTRFDSSNIGIKYRFTPGLWGRDESFGIMADYQRVNYNQTAYMTNGVGLFWARSLPQFFDNIFNYFPFFRYPKWVNAEYIQLFQNQTNNENQFLGGYNLTFYGKIMWTQFLYGDLGFGLKSYNLLEAPNTDKVYLRLYYLTLGLGINF